jgi:thymidine kinase
MNNIKSRFMAKLYFHYSSMNAGKSTALLQANHNYIERGMNTIIFTSINDQRYKESEINSRIGLSAKSNIFSDSVNLRKVIENSHKKKSIHCILIDEAQFLTKEHVRELGLVVDKLNIPVLTYGIRTDFKGELFEGSKYLLAWSDNIKEIKTVCHCGNKATMVVRISDNGSVESEGEQLEIGGNERYVPLCRKHFNSKKIN